MEVEDLVGGVIVEAWWAFPRITVKKDGKLYEVTVGHEYDNIKMDVKERT